MYDLVRAQRYIMMMVDMCEYIRVVAYHYRGIAFQECNCCRETQMEHRDVLLDQCYDVNGERILGPLGAMQLQLRVPIGCTCVPCTL